MTEPMLEELCQKKCKPCEGGVTPLSKAEAAKQIRVLPGWKLDEEGKQISIRYVMKNFMAAVNLINEIAGVAEGEDHHPEEGCRPGGKDRLLDPG